MKAVKKCPTGGVQGKVGAWMSGRSQTVAKYTLCRPTGQELIEGFDWEKAMIVMQRGTRYVTSLRVAINH